MSIMTGVESNGVTVSFYLQRELDGRRRIMELTHAQVDELKRAIMKVLVGD